MNTLNAGQDDWPEPGLPEPGEAADPHLLDDATGAGRLKKAPHAFRTISEVADELHVPQHVLRFWETRFSQVRPLKRGGGRRYYRPDDIELLRRISDLLYVQGYTIKGVQRMLREGCEPDVAALGDAAEDADLFHHDSQSAAAVAEIEPAVETDIETVAIVTIEDDSPDTAPVVPDEESVAGPSEIERISRENLILKDSLRGILVELQALRRLIPV
ncbi:MerR family transcriptional regulator [Gluconacetobacter sacchari]|uniref:MerR family transcriptional regulator n=1 Tax=Gluconacetobacter sacchari TaxID=92759 RepID=UPI0039B3B221